MAAYNVGYAMLLPWFIGGWLVNTGYCVYLLKKNKSLARFRAWRRRKHRQGGDHVAVVHGGRGLHRRHVALPHGRRVVVVGWPIFMAQTIAASTLLGVFSGKWTGVDRGMASYSAAWSYRFQRWCSPICPISSKSDPHHVSQDDIDV